MAARNTLLINKMTTGTAVNQFALNRFVTPDIQLMQF
jgi:hypothetical protein